MLWTLSREELDFWILAYSDTSYSYLMKTRTPTLRCDSLGRLTETVINRSLFLLDTSVVVASHQRNVKS